MGARAAFPFVAATWIGLACGAHAGVTTVLACLLAATAVIALAERAPTRTGAVLVAMAALLGGIARGGAHARRLEAARAALPADGSLVRMIARVAEPARREAEGPQALAVVLAATPRWPRGGVLRVRLPPGCAADWGDTLVALVRIERFETARNPGGFDALAAAGASGTLARGVAFAPLVRPARGVTALPARAAMRVRRAVERALARTLSPGARELAAPLLFGDRSAMSPELDATLRGSGLVHLLALSGLHVVWLAALVRGLVAFARGGLVARALAGAACAGAYVLLAGPLPSLVRAAVGEGLLALSRVRERALDPLQSLSLGAALLLACEPGWAGDLGFQLSCLATFGLVTLASPLSAPLASLPLAGRIVTPLATTLAAQLAALPLLLARFHALPWTGLAANLLAVPDSELLLAAAWLGGAADAALPGAGTVFLRACEPLALALRAIASAASSWPGALLAAGADPAPPRLAAVGVLLLAFGLAPPRSADDRLRGRGRARSLGAGLGALLVACALVAVAAVRPLAPPAGAWWLVAIDVGQGDALALASAGEWWMVDSGPRSPHWDAGEGAVLPFLRWAGVRTLARLVLTHDDGDHTGGAPAIRRALRVREWAAPAARPGVPGPGARFGARALGRGDTLAGAPRAVVLWPPRPGEPGETLARRGDNAAAVVMDAGEGAGRALLTADADSLVESALAVPPGVAVLKAGHHGSGSSSGAVFVRTLAPKRVLLSVGRHNVYGHPDAGALVRLAAGGAALDRTDREGAVWYELTREFGVRRIDWRRERLGERRAPAWRAAPRPAN